MTSRYFGCFQFIDVSTSTTNFQTRRTSLKCPCLPFLMKTFVIFTQNSASQVPDPLKLSAAGRRSHYYSAPSNPDHTKTRNFGGWVWVWYTVAYISTFSEVFIKLCFKSTRVSWTHQCPVKATFFVKMRMQIVTETIYVYIYFSYIYIYIYVFILFITMTFSQSLNILSSNCVISVDRNCVLLLLFFFTHINWQG